MKTSSDTARTADAVDPVPAPAVANSRRDATPESMRTSGKVSAGTRFDGALQSAWRRAASRGFAPGAEQEYLLEEEFGRATGREKTSDD